MTAKLTEAIAVLQRVSKSTRAGIDPKGAVICIIPVDVADAVEDFLRDVRRTEAPEVELESPPFTPKALDDFKARGFERTKCPSCGGRKHLPPRGEHPCDDCCNDANHGAP